MSNFGWNHASSITPRKLTVWRYDITKYFLKFSQPGVYGNNPVSRPVACKVSTACMATCISGTLKGSNMICVTFSLFALGSRGASVRRTLDVPLGGDSQLFTESVAPDLPRVIPVLNDPVLYWILLNSRVSLNLKVDASMPRPTNDAGEDSYWSVRHVR